MTERSLGLQPGCSRDSCGACSQSWVVVGGRVLASVHLHTQTLHMQLSGEEEQRQRQPRVRGSVRANS